MPSSSLVLVSVGNTRTRFAVASGGKLEPSRVLENTDPGAIAAAIRETLDASESAEPDAGERTAVIASVNHPAADAIEAALRAVSVKTLRFGRELPIPMLNALADDSTVGQDRLLDALGAFSRSGQACIVIDAGTAVTVDFVDGQGVFQGGAIAPGAAMMLRALHEKTSALPLVEPGALAEGPAAERAESGDGPFGKDTRSAMALGVVSAIRGMAHLLIDKYAEFYEAYPRVVATGGDAPLLFEHDELVETIVPDLTLIGMLAAVQKLDELDSEEGVERGGGGVE